MGREDARIVIGGERSGGDVTKGDKDECGREERDGSTWWGLEMQRRNIRWVWARGMAKGRRNGERGRAGARNKDRNGDAHG